MDGVTPLNQCPIVRGQTFTYRFNVSNPPGTYWYHGHTNRDRSDGLFGPFIILDPNEKKQKYQDLVAVIGDWYSRGSDSIYKSVRNEDTMFSNSFEDTTTCYSVSRGIVADRQGVYEWDSALINGRGWANITELKLYADRLPLEEFHVMSHSNMPIRMRLINSGMIYGLLFSVDEHRLTVVGADGSDIRPADNVDYIYVNPGERYDVVLKPIHGVSAVVNRSFAIRVKSMEKFDFFVRPQVELETDHIGLAWLIYDNGSKRVGYTEDNRVCTLHSKCVVVGCPFHQYPKQYNRTCIGYEQLRSTVRDDLGADDEILRPSPDHFEQYFLNFGFEDHVHTINGLQIKSPTYPPFLHPGQESQLIHDCDYDCGRKHTCSCTHHVNLTLGNVVELVLYGTGPVAGNAKDGFSHPVHLHGHHFYVLETVSGLSIR